jgi:hypothetical protein
LHLVYYLTLAVPMETRCDQANAEIYEWAMARWKHVATSYSLQYKKCAFDFAAV